MASFSKAILRVGEYQSPDGPVKVTPERLNHWAKQFRRMRGKRLGIPVGWDHSDKPDETVPVAFSRGAGPRTARNSAGWLSRFDVAPDGSHATIQLDIRDTDAKRKVSKNVVEVSPIIYPEWTDGRGRNWQDVITHIDLVNHPVDDSQTEFTPVDTVALSCQRLSLESGKSIYRLGSMKKHYRMEDEEDVKKPPMVDDEGDEFGEEDEPMDAAPAMPPADDEMPAEDDEYSDDEEMLDEAPVDDMPAESPTSFATQILNDLESVGIAVPNVSPDSDPQSFLGQLSAALRQKALDEQSAEADKAKEMSEEVIKKEAQKGMSDQYEEKTPEFAAMSRQVRASHHYAEQMTRKDLMKRLNDCLESGRCTPDQKNALAKEISAVRLSLNSKGEPSVSLAEKKLELIESYPAGAVIDFDERLRMATEVPPPNVTGDITDDEADTLVDQMFGKSKRA